ncbi:MAG: proton-conducting transporter membrane subunit, partial [Phycisphaeraceae bacterium]
MTPEGPTEMALKLQTLWPEIVLMLAAFTTMIMGISGSQFVRRATFYISGGALILATLLAALSPAMGIVQLSPISLYIKIAVGVIGLILLFVVVEMHDEQTDPNRDDKFDPSDTSRGEFYGFFLLSLAGAMLCAGADNLVWLFLSLELTSLPLYVMVVTSRQSPKASEAGVKYFFLGAFATAIFLYGFAMLYGAAGTTDFAGMQTVFVEEGLNTFAIVGLVFSIIGLCFKVAAFPMHFYLADVYQGASLPVTNFVAFTPKIAGFAALILIMDAAGWPGVEYAPSVIYLLAGIAVITMFTGNILALLQTSVKRVLAYSWMAHSG